MPNLKEVKGRINSVISTQQITKAMKMVAAAKLRRSQDRITQMRPFAQKLTAILQNLSASQEQNADAWYSAQREVKKVLIVAVSSDRGLCGSFNSNVFKGVLKLLAERYQEQAQAGNVTILPIGKKAFEFFSKRKGNVVGQFAGLIQNLNFTGVAEAGDFLMEEFKKGNYDKIEIVYNEFKNVATQILRTEQFLPVMPVAKEQSTSEVDYIYQPDKEEIITGLIPKSLKVQLFKALLDSNAAENGARMTAMDKATENAGELLKELKLTYNRTRQAAITKEILEIVAGAEALKSA
ncbi:MAG: ATP synthase F1 subunit gamma [Cyclobacteriaceae bacterium]|jgi:F-type H+-transporting ATPase subunit gamma|nr:ATP synthase F1 subunit gamma [Flammeovirgaceae bacterium]MCZ8022547.1 ATP synthase F1 subunit gamma [Cytophagales bacterium]MCZ8328944.1 ATP synthase F1 subunit gamma [Cyclobacteriaceae bacterium]